MPEAAPARAPTRPRRWRLPALAAGGLALALLAGVGGVVALLAGILAQPALALAVRQWRNGGDVDIALLRRDGPWLLALWAGAVVALAALLAWPLSALLDSGSLAAALLLSAVLGFALLGLWRLWPLCCGLERDGGSLPGHWRQLQGLELGAWRGLGAALAVAALALLVLALAWPGLLADATRWLLAPVLALASLAAHWWLQRVEAADELLVFDDEAVDTDELVDDDDDAAADASPDEPLEPALYAAARGGRVGRALELLDAGADPHALPPDEDDDRRSLPVLAAVLPDLRLLRALIGHGVDLNRVHAELTPLLAATRDSWHGRPDAVMTLLANGADPRAADAEGNTPLHHAARSSDPGVAALLRDAAAEIDALNHAGLTPLGVACNAGNWRLARFLLERGARPEPAGGQPALLAAAGSEEDDPAGVQLLLKLKARVDARNDDDRSALHEAARAGHDEIVAVLLAAGADAAAADRDGRSPLHEAALGGHGAVLERLLDHLGDDGLAVAGAVDGDGRNVLMLASAAEGMPPALATRLLALGLDPELRDQGGKRAIDRAAEAGRWALVSALDAGYALPASVRGGESDDPSGDESGSESEPPPPPDRAPAALLRDALAEGREPGMEGLAELLSPAELGALLHDGDDVLPPHQVAWLLRAGADPEVRNADGATPMTAWLARGPAALGSLQALLDHAVPPTGAGTLARFLAACAASERPPRELERVALDLLDRGADPFAPSNAGDPPLALAVRLGWPQLLARLLDSGVALDGHDSHGMSALHLAAALGREDMLKQLVRRGAAPDLLAADGQTPLGVALASGRRDLADWLDWRGWPLPKRPLQATDVPAAAIVGDADAVRRLLDLGLPVDATDSQGCTALLRAAGGGHRAVVDLLLARGADPTRAADSGATPLSAAVSMRHGEIVDCLLKAGAPIEQRLPGELSVLMVACALGLPDLAARLLAAGADIHAVDAQGRTALHCAAMFGFSARQRTRLVTLFDTLLLAGGEADLEIAAGGASPLLLLLGARAEPGSAADEEVLIAGLQLLLDHDARLDAQDPRGFGPLHLAALHGLLQVVKWLLRAGADPDLRDTLNRSPREIAVMRGFVDIAAELAPATPGGDVSMARFLRDR